MLYSIESVEDGLVTLTGDDERTIVVSAGQMAQPPLPGQLVRQEQDGLYHPDNAETQQRSSRIRRMLLEIRRKSAESSND